MSSKKVIKVGSRKSQLALIQTNLIIDKLKEINPDLKFEIVSMTTVGDRILDSALSKIGEKSLFTKELEESLKDGTVDFVVHSLKDLQTVLPEGMVIGCVNKRDDPHDAVVMHKKHDGKTLETLPEGSVVGTSSLRRIAQIRRKFPHLAIKDIRGNLNTRFHKLDDNDMYDAIVLAVAGLDRMNWSHRISQKLMPDVCMYAVSQGAIAVECRAEDSHMLEILQTLHDRDTAVRCVAERAFLRRLEGGCTVPVSTFTEIMDDKLVIRGGVYSVDGKEVVEDRSEVLLPKKQDEDSSSHVYCSIVGGRNGPMFLAAETVGIELADKLIKQGAATILTVAKRKAKEAIEEERVRKSARTENNKTAVSS
ncbi:porphobilinogen deaminase-like isoform X2 [Haliotis asinina]|uniref:porphobilinogen deaminase-like isoform X2 n=1 Tax=Haliotis asinina TaxID=109174 RepID=UPI003531D128